MSTKIKSLVGATAAVLMLGGAAMLATAPGASAAGEFHHIINAGHLPGDPAVPAGECLQPLTTDFRAPIVQRPCDGSSLQQWALLSTPSGGTHYRFLNADGWCLSTDSLRNGDPILADECTVGSNGTVSNAEWNASSTIIDNQAAFVSLASRLGFVNRAECLDEPGALAGNSNMQMWVCNGTSAQRWLVESNS